MDGWTLEKLSDTICILHIIYFNQLCLKLYLKAMQRENLWCYKMQHSSEESTRIHADKTKAKDQKQIRSSDIIVHRKSDAFAAETNFALLLQDFTAALVMPKLAADISGG